jgi:peptidoglycan/xylan/chitin deacetylase (PgdA/CDA1 family)
MHESTEPAPTQRHVKGPHRRPVPILMYHVVAAPPRNAPYPELYVLPGDFRAQMTWLARNGYHAVTLDQVYEFWRNGVALPRHPIVVSFDDGYLSQYVNALPVLQRHHWPGVLNLALKDMRVSWGLSPRRIRALIEAGWEIDSHTISHADLTTLDPASLRREVAGSRRRLRKEFGVPVDFFCYPAGRYDPAVVAAVKRAGYLGATTVEPGLARPAQLFTLARVRISGSDGLRGFAARLGALEP